MKTPTLLEQAKAFTQRTAGGAALTILPLAAAAVAVVPDTTHAASNVVFQPTAPTYNPPTNFFIPSSGGSTAGSKALPPFNGVTGESSFGNATFFTFGSGGGFTNQTVVSINGGRIGNGTFTQGNVVPVSYTFTLSQTGALLLGNWSLTFNIIVGGAGPSGSGTASNSISFTNVGTNQTTGTFTGFGNIVIQNLGTTGLSGGQTPFVGYSLAFNESVSLSSPTFSSFTIDIPTSSFDFNAVVVPEPTTWTMMGLGALGLGIYAAHRRRQTAA